MISTENVGGKLLNGINGVYVKSPECVRVNGCESECFRIDRSVRQVCIMSPWLLNVFVDIVMKEVKMGMGKKGVRFQKEEREWIFPGLLHGDDLVLCGKSEEDLRAIVGRFIEVCRGRGLKVNAGKSNVILLGGKEGSKC